MRVALLALLLAGCNSSTSSPASDPFADYFAHRGGPLDTFAMVNVAGIPVDWSDPATADWPSATLDGSGWLRGQGWDVWRDAILARNPALTQATFVDPAWNELKSADIVLYTDAAGHERVQYNGEALEHYLSMHKWVVLQHAIPPRTIERIRARSRVGTRFGLFCNFEAVAYTRAFTHILRPAQDALIPFRMEGIRPNANGFVDVDVRGHTANPDVPDLSLGQLTDTHVPARWWYVDVRKPGAADAVWNATLALEAAYGDSLDFIFWDNVLFNPYFGDAQWYAGSPYANAPWNVPVGLPNPDPLTTADYRAGWVRLLEKQAGRVTWGNSGYPPAPEYDKTRLGVAYEEFFFGNPGISQPLPTWASIEARIDQAAAEQRPMVIGQYCAPGEPQALWMTSPMQWADIAARVASQQAVVFVQSTRQWSIWQPGFLPPDGP